MIRLAIDPVPKPRMTRADRWKKRDCVQRYWAYKDRLRSLITGEDLPAAYHVVFIMPMPASWSRKKRAAMLWQPHQAKPDRDNLEKAFLDALFDDDAAIWDGRTSKVWGDVGSIVVLPIEPFDTMSIANIKPYKNPTDLPESLAG